MDQLPRSADLMARAVTALLGDLSGDRRAARERYAQSGPTGGRWGDVLRGWQSQAEVVRGRLTDEVMSARLDRRGGPELRDLAKSEYFAELPPDPQTAVGEVTLVRTVINNSSATTGNFNTGVIPVGTRVSLTPSGASARVQSTSAEYLTTEVGQCGRSDTAAPGDNGDGTWTHTQSITIGIEASRAGPHANRPAYFQNINTVTRTVASVLFDSFTVTALSAAGGTLGAVDDQIRALSRAMATGGNGPTSKAAVAGSLTSPSVRRAVYVENPVTAIASLYLADESWASSARYRSQILQYLRTYPWLGWGARVAVGSVANSGVVVTPTLVLRKREYESAQSEITENVKNALIAYFDERPDWYTWTLNAIGATCGAADDRILVCSAVLVVNSLGIAVAAVDEAGVVTGTEPSATITPGAVQISHYALIDQGVTPIYELPGA